MEVPQHRQFRRQTARSDGDRVGSRGEQLTGPTPSRSPRGRLCRARGRVWSL